MKKVVQITLGLVFVVSGLASTAALIGCSSNQGTLHKHEVKTIVTTTTETTEHPEHGHKDDEGPFGSRLLVAYYSSSLACTRPAPGVRAQATERRVG